MRFDTTSSCLSDSYINTLVGIQDSVAVALRQAVDKVIYQGHLRTKEIEHTKVLRLVLCRQVRVATSKISTRASSRLWTKTLRIGDVFVGLESAAGKVICHKG